MKATITYLLIFISNFYSSGQEIKNDTITKYGLTGIGKTIGGKKDGKWITYKDNKIVKIENFKNDELNGEEIYYHENGQIISKGNYVNDKPDGEHISYYYNGKIKSVENYKNGLEHGKFIDYFNNGKIKYSGNYVNGIEEGEFVHYDKEGKIVDKGSFKNGKKIGVWIETEEKEGGLGIPKTIRVKTKNYSTNEESIKIYDKLTGKLDRIENYKNGKLLNSK